MQHASRPAREPRVAESKSGVEETRSRILAAARVLFADRGSRGTTTREVADRANVNEATLFRHFGTKTQLLGEMLEHYSTSQALPEIFARVDTLASIEERLFELASQTIDEMREREDLIRVTMAEELANPAGLSCAWRAPTETRRLMTDWFEQRTRTRELRGEPEFLARTFMSLIFAFVMARKIWAGIDAPQERSVAHLVDIFLNGARER